MASSSGAASTLVSLPCELRRIIVNHLGPATPESLLPGCKTDLKNANLAHRCLRECVPDVMFRDMALEHVIVGQASHLERFASNHTSPLLKHVKYIQVKVPPAIRWDVDTLELTPEDLTMRHLCDKFEVHEPDELPEHARRYCENYHRALVEPFIDNRRWYALLRNAQASWPDIFDAFPNLQEIAVGCCERVHHPSQTYTNVFLSRHGKQAVSELRPYYLEDPTVNMGWASAVVLESVPPGLRSLQLSMANIDNLNSFATVNRLLSIVYRSSLFVASNPPLGITKLSITLRGVRGVHGSEPSSDTGSAGLVQYWEKVLNLLHNLKHLEFHQHRHSDDLALAYTDGERTNKVGNVVTMILAKLQHPQLETVRLHGFSLDEVTLMDIFRDNVVVQSPCLQTFILDNIRLACVAPPTYLDEVPSTYLEEDGQDVWPHWNKSWMRAQGEGWLNICKTITHSIAGVQIVLRDPSQNIEQHYTNDGNNTSCALNPAFIKYIQSVPGFQLDISDDYTSKFSPPFKSVEEFVTFMGNTSTQ